MKVILKANPDTVFKDISVDRFPFIIGRSENPFAELMYDSKEMNQAVSLLSRSHAVISEKKGTYFIHDLGSKNGTRLNDQPIGAVPVEMKQGDRLVIAESLDYTLTIDYPPTVDECDSFSVTLIPEDFQSGLPAVSISSFPFKIGRKEDDFTPYVEKFPEQLRTLSRTHAHLTCDGDQVYVQDFNSANGTFLFGERLKQEPEPLIDGAKLSFGPFFQYMVRIYSKDVEETVVLGQEATVDTDLTVIVDQESPAAQGKQLPPKAAESSGQWISTPAPEHPPIPPKGGESSGQWISTPAPENPPIPPASPAQADATPKADPHATLSRKAGDGHLTQGAEEENVEDQTSPTGKTVYMSSATQFLKILTPDEKKTTDGLTQSGGKGEKAVAGDGKSKNRKLVFIKEIANAFWGDSAGKKGRHLALLLILLIAAAGAGWYLFTNTPEQQLKKLWAAKEYAAYAKLANAVLAEKPHNESLRLKATDALILAILPEFTNQLKKGDFASAKAALLRVPALSEHNPAGEKSLSLLEWVVDMESYFHTKGADPPLEIFEDEAKIEALLDVWEKERTDYRLLMELMMGKYPPFESTHSLVFHHLNVLKKKGVIIGPINALKQAINARLNDGQIEQIAAIVSDYERRYPEIKGLEKLRSDADKYKVLLSHIDKNDFVSAHDFLEQVNFVSPLFSQQVAQLKTTKLPPVEVARRYGQSAEAWAAGNAEKAIFLLEPITGDEWGGQAAEKIKHYRQVMDAFAGLTKAKGSAGYAAKLIDFRKLLQPDEDRFYHNLTEDDYSTVRDRELKRAQNLFGQAQRSWRKYTKSGRITGFLRLETSLSGRFKKRAGYLNTSFARSQAAADIHRDLNQNMPSKWEALHNAITEEVQVQRLRIEDLRDVLGEEISGAKLKLLPRP